MTGDDVRTELQRVVDRLRSMPLTRLATPCDGYPSRAACARALAQRLADRGADLGGWSRHTVPDAGDAAVGDQVAVTAADLLALPLDDDELRALTTDLRAVRLTL
ncbi:MAG: hypothetical protein ACO3JT_00340 [Candidatus Nanopelagicales bacterium]